MALLETTVVQEGTVVSSEAKAVLEEKEEVLVYLPITVITEH